MVNPKRKAQAIVVHTQKQALATGNPQKRRNLMNTVHRVTTKRLRSLLKTTLKVQAILIRASLMIPKAQATQPIHQNIKALSQVVTAKNHQNNKIINLKVAIVALVKSLRNQPMVPLQKNLMAHSLIYQQCQRPQVLPHIKNPRRVKR